MAQDTPKPRGWQGNDKSFSVLTAQDGHISPIETSDTPSTENDRDPSNPRVY